jgi:hypothetical protein
LDSIVVKSYRHQVPVPDMVCPEFSLGILFYYILVSDGFTGENSVGRLHNERRYFSLRKSELSVYRRKNVIISSVGVMLFLNVQMMFIFKVKYDMLINMVI